MTGNISTRSRGGNEISAPVNPKMRITPTPENPRGYPLFDMYSICGFTNNQVIFYLTTGAIPLEDQPQFQEAMEHRKKALQATNWDGASDGGRRNDEVDTAEIPESSDSECPTPALDWPDQTMGLGLDRTGLILVRSGPKVKDRTVKQSPFLD